MRILLVVYGSLEQLSGGYLYDRQVVAYLRERGVRVDVLSLPRCPYLLCPLARAGRPGQVRRPLAVLRRGLETRDGAGRVDGVLVDELVHPSVFRTVARRGPTGPPVLTLVHHLKSQEPIAPLLRRLARGMEGVLLRHSQAVLVNSRLTGETVRELAGAEVPLYLCPPGSDLLSGIEAPASRRGPRGSADPVRLLVTGNLIHRKGHDLLLRMLAGLKELPWRLRIVGRGVDRRYRRHLGRLERRFGLAGRIEYTGELNGRELAGEYRRADVFVFPSRYEGYGISLAEAVRAGLPFVAFASGAVGEVTAGRGLLFPPGDLAGFAAALAGLIADPGRRRRAARLSRALAPGLPVWADTGRSVYRALQEVLGHV